MFASVVEFTDPGCPFAWSAEPARRRVQWLYDGHLDWSVRLVGLGTREHYVEKGFTPEVLGRSRRLLGERHGMPMSTEPVDAAGTIDACRAVVAAREHAPERASALLRAIRLRGFAGEAIDDPAVLAAAARDAGIDPEQLAGWDADEALAADMAAARDPKPAAVALHHKLARDGDGWRYTCPSLELTANGTALVAPGFQPVESYEVALANLLPDVQRRADPESAAEVLAWAAGEPLATREVAAVLGVGDDEAREQLSADAERHPLGQSEVWTAR